MKSKCLIAPAPVAGDAVRSHMEALYRALAAIGIVGVIDEYDVIRRSSVLDIVRRYTYGPHALAQDRASQAAAPSAPVEVPDSVIVLLNHLETLMDEGTLKEDAIPTDMWNAVSMHNFALAQQPAAHPAITHCDNCGCDWLDNGLNPVGCPYCKQPAAVDEASRD